MENTKPSELAYFIAALCDAPDGDLDQDAALIDAELAPLVDALERVTNAYDAHPIVSAAVTNARTALDRVKGGGA